MITKFKEYDILGKYIICDDIRVDGVSIYKVYKYMDNDGLAMKILYRYTDKGEDTFIKDMVYYGNKLENLNIHYVTDDFEDAVKKIPFIYNLSKYNL
jgi:hypothetical protein